MPPIESSAVTAIEETIREFIVASFLDDEQAAGFRNDEDLLTILDSLQVLRVLIDVESRYSIQVDHSELTPENLGTVERLAAFIARKRQEATC